MKSLDAYKRTQVAAAHVDVRQAEADALLRVAREMEVSAEGEKRALMEALVRNIQLWNIFGHDCASEGNQLPQELKTQIVSLAVWAVGQSEKAINGEVDVSALVDVNRTIARGLTTGTESPGVPAEPQVGGSLA